MKVDGNKFIFCSNRNISKNPERQNYWMFSTFGKKFDPSIISVISYFKVFSYFWSNIKATLFKLKFIQINLPDLSNRKFNHFNKFHIVLIHQGKVNIIIIIIMILTS